MYWDEIEERELLRSDMVHRVTQPIENIQKKGLVTTQDRRKWITYLWKDRIMSIILETKYYW